MAAASTPSSVLYSCLVPADRWSKSINDRALALPPLNTTLAQRMMEQTQIFTALKGVRGRKPVDLPALESLLVRFSQLVVEQPWISEIDINPLLASPGQLLALDARVGYCTRPGLILIIFPDRRFGLTLRSISSSWMIKYSTSVLLRPVRPEDEQQYVM